MALAWIKRLYEVVDAAKKELVAATARLVQSSSGTAAAATRRELAEGILHCLRRERSVAILDGFGAWLEATAGEVLPKSPMGEAVGYPRNHWAALKR